MAFHFENVPYLEPGMEQVWNPERRMDRTSSIPSIPSTPNHSRTYRRARIRVCARVYTYLLLVWKVWKVWKRCMNKGYPTSILVPYLC